MNQKIIKIKIYLNLVQEDMNQKITKIKIFLKLVQEDMSQKIKLKMNQKQK